MKALLFKERRLASSPLSWIFVAFSAMTLLPGYPILTGALFVCLGMFYSVHGARESNDIPYSLLLPVEKRDIVRVKFIYCRRIEAAAFCLMAALTALRLTLLRNFPPYLTNVLMPANPVYLAFVLLIFAAFHMFFLAGFFKTCKAVGRPFLRFLIASVLLIAAGETLHHLPGLQILSDTGLRPLLVQSAVLAVAMVVYALVSLLAQRSSIRRFEAINFY